MTPNDINEQMVRIEEFSNGLKQGATMMGMWLIKKMQEEVTSAGTKTDSGTPEHVESKGD